MRETAVEFFSEGTRIAGLLRHPNGRGPWPGIVHGPGWLGLKDAKLYTRYHGALTEAGYAVLVFDYRGFGASGGSRGTLSPRMQLEDLVNAVTFLTSRPDIDPLSIGVFGSGGTGGGNAVMLAATDDRVLCAVSQVPVADGADWLRRMRPHESEWTEFVSRLSKDREARVLTGRGEMVDPREDIMVQTAERRSTTVKADVDGRVPERVALGYADEIMRYRPVDAAPRVSHLLVIAVAGDEVTPTDHAYALFEAAREPKKLILQHGTSHYAAYEVYGEEVTGHIVDWFDEHLRATATVSGAEIVELRP